MNMPCHGFTMIESQRPQFKKLVEEVRLSMDPSYSSVYIRGLAEILGQAYALNQAHVLGLSL